MTRDLVTDANRNLRTCFLRLADDVPGGETRQFGPLTGASTGLPLPIYNRVFVFDSPPWEELAAAVAWLVDRAVPSAVTVTESVVDTVEELAADIGLSRMEEIPLPVPGMAMPSLDEIPPSESAATITEATTVEELDPFVAVAAAVFETPPEVAEQVYRAAVTADEARLFLGTVNDRPAASGVLIRSGDVAGVYTIAVKEAFRRQGIGEAMSWRVLRAGRAAGCQVGVLQSSEMAAPLYEGMGFETVVNYYHFAPDS